MSNTPLGQNEWWNRQKSALEVMRLNNPKFADIRGSDSPGSNVPKQESYYSRARAADPTGIGGGNAGASVQQPLGDDGYRDLQQSGWKGTNGRHNTRVNELNVHQTGTQMGGVGGPIPELTVDIANEALGKQVPGAKLGTKFQSTALPNTKAGVFQQNYANMGDASFGEHKWDSTIDPSLLGSVNPLVEGDKYGAFSSNDLPSGINDKDFWNSSAKGFETVTPGLQERYLSQPEKVSKNSFLDPNLDSMQALRARESELGIFHTAGQSYLKGAGDSQDMTKITRDEKRNIMSGTITADELRNKYVKGLTETNTPKTGATPSGAIDTEGIAFDTPMEPISADTPDLSEQLIEKDVFNAENAVPGPGADFGKTTLGTSLAENISFNPVSSFFS